MTPEDSLRETLRRAVGTDSVALSELTSALDSEMRSGPADEAVGRVARAVHDALRDVNRVSLIVTGLAWLGGGIRAIENAMIGLIAEAERELTLAVYAMSPAPDRLWAALARALDGGIRCTLVVDRLDEQNAGMRTWLTDALAEHRATLRVADFHGQDSNDHLHAKIVVADRRRAIVGSANLTAHGLLLAHELAVMLEGPVAEAVAERIDLLARSHLVRRPA